VVEAPKEPEKKAVRKKCATSKCTKETKKKIPTQISSFKQNKKQIIAGDYDQKSASESEQNQLNKQKRSCLSNNSGANSVLKKKVSCASSKADSCSGSSVSPSKKASCASRSQTAMTNSESSS